MLVNYETNHPNTIVPIVVLYDAYQPYSYEQWGSEGTENFPIIISDSENIISDSYELVNSEWFEFEDFDFPINIIIDQNMEIIDIIQGEIPPHDLEGYFNQLNN